MIAHGGLMHLLELAALPVAVSTAGLGVWTYRLRTRVPRSRRDRDGG